MVRRRGNGRQSLGTRGENAAARYLQARGLQLIARNLRYRVGELDLVMRDGECLVIVEVRVRGRQALLPAAESVDQRKQQKLVRAASAFIASQPDCAERPVRFDVVAIDGDGEAAVNWIRDAFRPGE